MKTVSSIFLYSGIILMILASLMFIYSLHMFTYTGKFNTLEKDIGELSFAIWLPALFVGFILRKVGVTMRSDERNKIP